MKKCRFCKTEIKKGEFCDDCKAEIEAERMYELRANFEPGTTVVNILTGEKTKI